MTPKDDRFFEKAAQWQQEFEQLRTPGLDCGLTAELKRRALPPADAHPAPGRAQLLPPKTIDLLRRRALSGKNCPFFS